MANLTLDSCVRHTYCTGYSDGRKFGARYLEKGSEDVLERFRHRGTGTGNPKTIRLRLTERFDENRSQERGSAKITNDITAVAIANQRESL